MSICNLAAARAARQRRQTLGKKKRLPGSTPQASAVQTRLAPGNHRARKVRQPTTLVASQFAGTNHLRIASKLWKGRPSGRVFE